LLTGTGFTDRDKLINLRGKRELLIETLNKREFSSTSGGAGLVELFSDEGI
jgi:hypothetical protein